MVKTPEELSALHGASEAVDRVHARIGEWLRPGRTEDEIGSDIAAALAEEGHERADFVIVASGPHGASPPPRAVRPCRARRRARRRRHRRAGAQRPLQRFDAVQPQRAGLAPSRLSPVGVGPGETAAGQCGARPTRPSGGDGTGLGPCERTRPPSHDRRVLCRHVVRAIVNNLGPLLFVIHGGHRQQEGLPAGPDRA